MSLNLPLLNKNGGLIENLDNSFNEILKIRRNRGFINSKHPNDLVKNNIKEYNYNLSGLDNQDVINKGI